MSQKFIRVKYKDGSDTIVDTSESDATSAAIRHATLTNPDVAVASTEPVKRNPANLKEWVKV